MDLKNENRITLEEDVTSLKRVAYAFLILWAVAILFCLCGCDDMVTIGPHECVQVITKEFGEAVCQEATCPSSGACQAYECSLKECNDLQCSTTAMNFHHTVSIVLQGNAILNRGVECK